MIGDAEEPVATRSFPAVDVPAAVQHIIATIFAAQNALKALAPEYKWQGLGNLLGDFGEYIAVKNYGLTKAPAGSSGYDALTKDGQKVQVKANFAASQIGFRGEADLLLVLQFNADGSSQEIYFGKHDIVKAQARFSARDNKHMIAITKLKILTKLGSVPISDGE